MQHATEVISKVYTLTNKQSRVCLVSSLVLRIQFRNKMGNLWAFNHTATDKNELNEQNKAINLAFGPLAAAAGLQSHSHDPYPGSLVVAGYSPNNKKSFLRLSRKHSLCVIPALMYCSVFFHSIIPEGQPKLPVISGYCSQAAEGNGLVCTIYLHSIDCPGSQTFPDAITGNWKSVQ